MKAFFTRKRLAMTCTVLGVTLMGVDLMMTRNFFTHIGELMALSIVFFVFGLILDREPRTKRNASCPRPPAGRSRFAKPGRS